MEHRSATMVLALSVFGVACGGSGDDASIDAGRDGGPSCGIVGCGAGQHLDRVDCRCASDVMEDAGSDAQVCSVVCAAGYRPTATCGCEAIGALTAPPPRGSYRAVTHAGAPSPRWGHTIVWTGHEYVVWGGSPVVTDYGGAIDPLADGGRYDPVADAWTPTSATGAPSARAGHKAVWTGHEMAIFGRDVDVFPTKPMEGWLYDPTTDAWRPMSTTGAPVTRAYYDVIAVDGKVIVWGGWLAPGIGTEQQPAATGGIYDPATDTWSAISEMNAPRYDRGHVTLATRSGFVTLGATGVYAPPNVGELVAARYDLATSTWTTTAAVSEPNPGGYRTSLVIDDVLVTIATPISSPLCELMELGASGWESTTVGDGTMESPYCLSTGQLDPLHANGFIVAPELRLLLERAAGTLFSMPPPPWEALAAEALPPLVAASGGGRWDQYASATDGTDVFFFGGMITGQEMSSCSRGPTPGAAAGAQAAPCAIAPAIMVGALGTIYTP